MNEPKILLISFYNEKALGVRYLSAALANRGFEPHIVFFKDFNSILPKAATETEITLLCDVIREVQPLMIGLSVMSSLYLETIELVNTRIREEFSIPVVWGGVYATLEPQRAARRCDYVLRGEGEDAICDLAKALYTGVPVDTIQNLSWYDGGNYRENDVRPIECDVDRFGYPPIGGPHMVWIYQNRAVPGDPQLHSFSYELSASRGCPFSCSYCSAANLRRVYAGKGTYLRFRSVDSVIRELLEAKSKMPHLRIVHFWDEIFCDAQGWVEEFSERYRRQIGLPFRIWGHPLKINSKAISLLVDAGLHQISVGIQSGSPSLRKEIFHRPESQEQIIEASRVLSACRVPQVYYDLMLCHPFETPEQLQETFDLCLKLTPPFSLNIHGLNFLPATDIVEMAQAQGLLTAQELENMMYCSIQKQYDAYWGPYAHHQIHDDSNIWVSLIYLTQFPQVRRRVIALSMQCDQPRSQKQILRLKRYLQLYDRIERLIQKAALVIHRKSM